MNRSISNDEILEYCRLRLEGYTFKRIGEKFGLSGESVRSSISRNIGIGIKTRDDYKKIVYPAISEFIQKEHMTVKSLSNLVGMTYTTVLPYLRGRANPTKKFIDKMIEITGIPYEKLFERSDDNEKE